MAFQEDIVRISYKDLEEIADKNAKSSGKRVEKYHQDSQSKQRRDSLNKKQRRPTRDIYQPGVTQLKKKTDSENTKDHKAFGLKTAAENEYSTTDDESYRASKESSVERDIEHISGSLSSTNLRETEYDRFRRNSPIDRKKRYKRPDLQIYVPRAKLMEKDFKKGEEKCEDAILDDKTQQQNASLSRKVNITDKSDLKNMVVTVVNDQAATAGISKPSSIKSERDEQEVLSQSEVVALHLKEERQERFKSETSKSSQDALRDGGADFLSSQGQKPPRHSSFSKSGHKRYSVLNRRQRTGSVSSDVSATSDASIEDANGGKTFDWDEEVQREMALAVQEETKKMQEMIDQDNHARKEQSHWAQQGTGNRRVRTESGSSQYSEYARSRRRGRKKSKTRSRDSSLHSNPPREKPTNKNDEVNESRTRRRKGHYENTQRYKGGSQNGVNEPEDLRKFNLKVTFGKSERQVKVDEDAYQRRSGQETSCSDVHQIPKCGGLIHLPPNTSTQSDDHSHMHHHPKDVPQSRRGSHPRPRDQGGGCSGGGGGGASSGKKVLFDPNNPNKPIIIKNSNLKFYDPYESVQSSDPYSRNYTHFYSEYGYGYPDMCQGSPHSDNFYYGYHPNFKESGICHDDTYNRDPYYHNGYDQDFVISGRSRSQCRAMSEHLLHDALPLDSQLGNLLSRGSVEDNMQRIMHLRQELQNKYEQIILLDPDIANKHNVEQLLWKSVYYQFIEIYRHRASEDLVKSQLLKILDEGTAFYEGLLQRLQSSYGFALAPFLDMSALPPENLNRTVKLALLTAQRTMICLGDIARYRELANESTNYGKARSWYMKAQQLAPKNGRPYNQLAILALYTKRKLDAVYYYMRSLAASNPFLTARESLMSLFDEARKKAEAAEKKRVCDREKIKKLKKKRRQQGHRIEIWIAPDGTSWEDQVDDTYEEDLSKLPIDKLNRRFVLSFLNVHGKLFTKIGMETFPEICSQMLQEFQTLLQQSHPTITGVRILQLMAINMFTIENTALKSDSLDENCRSLLQEHAVQLGLDMFGILVDRCAEFLEDHLHSSDYPRQLLNYALIYYIPAVKVWSDWMICHSTLWIPPPSVNDPDLGPNVDVWKSLAKLFNVLKNVDTSHLRLYKEKKEGCDPVILNENTMLSGFVPLLSAPIDLTYVHSTVDKDIAKDCLRIQNLQVFGDYLCGVEPPMLAFNVERKDYYSVAPTRSKEIEKKDNPCEAAISSDEDVIIETEEDEDLTSGDEEHVKQLKAKKEELKRKVEEQTRHQQNLEAMLERHRTYSIELEIRPIFLVPDTNCFIDHLSRLKKLILSGKYTVTIPLIVINELNGLARGSREGHYDTLEHADMVTEQAKQAVAFLEEQFEQKNSHLRAQTAKGSILETIVFRSEETDGKGNNDDLILSCCLHYCKDRARDFMPKNKDSPIHLYRDVVLLTDDRNLRLKAHTCNVPVKDVHSFIKWSKIT